MIKVIADGFRGYGCFVTLMLSVTFVLSSASAGAERETGTGM